MPYRLGSIPVHQPFDQHEQVVEGPAHVRRALVEELETLDARDGTREAFMLLLDAYILVIALSNGAKSSTKALLQRAGLASLVEAVISADEVKLAKPRAEVYLYSVDKARVPPAGLALVAAHPWDINGAAAAGLVTAYLDADRPYSRTMRAPDLKALTLPELARQLIAL